MVKKSQRKLRSYLVKAPLVKDLYYKKNQLLNRASGQLNVAMLHTARCGSTVLGNMLNQHSAVYWSGEIFNKYMKDPEAHKYHSDIVKDTIEDSRKNFASKVYGYETKYLPQQHLSGININMSLTDYIDHLRSIGFGTFIVLQRENYLRRAISIRMAGRNKQWHAKEKPSKAEKVNISIDNFSTGVKKQPLLELFNDIDENYGILHKILGQEEALFLSYEKNIQDNPFQAYDTICDFLKIEREQPDIVFHRTNPFDTREMISNFDEIENLLRGTKYEWMLNQ